MLLNHRHLAARLARSTMSAAQPADVLRVLSVRQRTARQVAWALSARLDDIEVRLGKMLARGMVRVVGQRRRRSGALDDVFAACE